MKKEDELPVNKTCGDCVHIYRCSKIYGHVESDKYCDWIPIRFQEKTEVRING
jgi:hypothetical protein